MGGSFCGALFYWSAISPERDLLRKSNRPSFSVSLEPKFHNIIFDFGKVLKAVNASRLAHNLQDLEVCQDPAVICYYAEQISLL